jgi:hypothetical protein
VEHLQQLALNLYPNPDPQTGEVWIRTPRDHGRLVHGGGMGCVSIAQKAPRSGLWRERAHPVEVAIELLKHYQGQEDTYLSTQRFRGRRRIVHLLSLGSLFADLDYYRIPELIGSHPLAVLEIALSALQKAAMPEPTGNRVGERAVPLMAPLSDPPRCTSTVDRLPEKLVGGPKVRRCRQGCHRRCKGLAGCGHPSQRHRGGGRAPPPFLCMPTPLPKADQLAVNLEGLGRRLPSNDLKTFLLGEAFFLPGEANFGECFFYALG